MPNIYRSYATHKEALRIAEEATETFEKIVTKAREPGGPLAGVADHYLAHVPWRFYTDQPLRGPHRAKFVVNAMLGFQLDGANIPEPKEGWATRWPIDQYAKLVLAEAVRCGRLEQQARLDREAVALKERAFTGCEGAEVRVSKGLSPQGLERANVVILLNGLTDEQVLHLGKLLRGWCEDKEGPDPR